MDSNDMTPASTSSDAPFGSTSRKSLRRAASRSNLVEPEPSYAPLAGTDSEDLGYRDGSQAQVHFGATGTEDIKANIRTSLLGEKPAVSFNDDTANPGWCLCGSLHGCRAWCRNVVESTCMSAFMVIVTIFALVSTDIRDLCTNRPADIYFDYAIVASMAIFIFEFSLSCFGKEDYMCGFFFLLDIVSTLSMAFDVSKIDYYISRGGDTNLSSARAGRTARLGARAARMVRVIRLLRLVKIYKAIMASRSDEHEEGNRSGSTSGKLTATSQDLQTFEQAGIAFAGFVDYEDDEVEMFENQVGNSESRVGAKLSELTTRRVITVVMMLMLGLPALQVDRSELSPSSTQFGADVVWKAFQAMVSGSGTREDYESTLLNYMFYHNWYASSNTCPSAGSCSKKYLSHLFWIGVEGNDTSLVFAKSKAAALHAKSVDTFSKNIADQNDLYNYGTMPLEVLTLLGESWNVQCNDHALSRLGLSLIQDEIPGANSWSVLCPQDLRPHERVAYHPMMITADNYNQYHLVFYFDLRPFVRTESVLSLCECAFVCVMFAFASMMLSHDVTYLVLIPIERMIQLMKLIRNDPRMAAKMASDELKNELVDQTIDNKLGRTAMGRLMKFLQTLVSCEACEKQGHQSPLETVILEKTIMRLASLLTLGLGEAGLEIIGHSLSGSANAGIVDVYALPSSTVDCVMAVVRCQDFNTAIEVLQEKVVKFVTHIVEIVHGVIHEYHGAPNRNNGDNMLLIWRLFDDDGEHSIGRLSEMALLSCVKIYAAVSKSNNLVEFASHPGFQQRLGSKYRVSLTFGIHMGWAIEGAVGSEVKIDATYFSPHVNITFAVENATSIYRVPILATGAVVDWFTDEMLDKCRLIDRVSIQGSKEPLDLFSLDLDRSGLKPLPVEPLPVKWNIRTRFIVRQWMDMQRNMVMEDDMPVVFFFQDDMDIENMRRCYTEAFINTFSNAYQCYALGEWEAAASRFRRTLTMAGFEDGPSRALLNFMQLPYDFKAPKNWQGVRKLDTIGASFERPLAEFLK